MTRSAWFRQWFGHEYLALYPHRDGAEARRAVHLLRRTADAAAGTRVLDLGCGAGRHLAELRRIGCQATGLDLSFRMLQAARSRVPEVALVRADMRQLPFANRAFDVVASYFTTFGYFEDEADDRFVLQEVRRVLGSGGTFLLDFMNAEHVIANLKLKDRQTVRGTPVLQERRLVNSGRVVEKRIRIGPGKDRPEQTFVERVRLYRPEELRAMLRQVQLSPGQAFGGYDCVPFSAGSSRYIVIAKAV